MFCCLLATLLLSSLFPPVVYSAVDVSSLKPLLSPGASVGTSAPRWSEFAAPMPGAVVHVANEVDVQTTVKWAVSRNIRFLTQNGGNGWATTFKIGPNDIVINLDGLRSITFNGEKTEMTVAGGAIISDVVQAASSTGILVATGSCNCVGYLGAVLGGGIGPLQGQYGLGVDELISLNIVLANGTAASVSTSSNIDLWYALRGAAPNFAIVTSAVVRAHPAPEGGLQAWAGSLLFRPDQLEAIIGAVGQLTINAKMALTLTFVNQAATNSQVIIASPFYLGTADAGRAAFESLIRIGPFSDGTAVTPYTSWNNGSNNACVKGGRRPTWGVGLERMDPTIWRKVYNVWLDLIKEPGAERSSILLNAYATEKVRAAPDSSSAVPWRRSISFHASMTAFYTNASFDPKALTYGQKARSLWRSSNRDCPDKVYINNAFGDEPAPVVYGASLPRLSALKRKFDPNRRFDQWFPI